MGELNVRHAVIVVGASAVIVVSELNEFVDVLRESPSHLTSLPITRGPSVGRVKSPACMEDTGYLCKGAESWATLSPDLIRGLVVLAGTSLIPTSIQPTSRIWNPGTDSHPIDSFTPLEAAKTRPTAQEVLQ